MELKQVAEQKMEIIITAHNKWVHSKYLQGFHSPHECTSKKAQLSQSESIRTENFYQFPKFIKYCDKCNTSMYPFSELPEPVKEYRREIISSILDVIVELEEIEKIEELA